MSNVNFKNSLPASLISNKLSGLQWITPQRPNDVSKEIEEINKIKKILQEKNNFILLSNYSFFSTILNKRSHSPTRWFTFDGTDYPRDSGKFKDYYKKLFIKNIKDNKVDKIFIIDPIKSDELFNYFDKSCFIEKKYLKNLKEFKITPCKDISFKF